MANNNSYYGTANSYNPANLANTMWNQVNAPVSRAVTSAASLPKRYFDFALGDDISQARKDWNNRGNESAWGNAVNLGSNTAILGLDAASLFFPELFALKGLKAANAIRKTGKFKTPLMDWMKSPQGFLYGGEKLGSNVAKNTATAFKAGFNVPMLTNGISNQTQFINQTPFMLPQITPPAQPKLLYGPNGESLVPGSLPYKQASVSSSHPGMPAGVTQRTGNVPTMNTAMDLNTFLKQNGIDAKTGLTASQSAFANAKGGVASDAYKGIVANSRNIINTTDAGAARDIEQLKQSYTGGLQDTANLQADLGTLGSPAISAGNQISSENALRGGIQNIQTTGAANKAKALLDIATGKVSLKNAGADLQMGNADYASQNLINSILYSGLPEAQQQALYQEAKKRGLL